MTTNDNLLQRVARAILNKGETQARLPQATLPLDRSVRWIADMRPGDSGWTSPGWMYAEEDSTLWLNGNGVIEDAPIQERTMKVWRDDAGHWHVDASRTSRQWNPDGPPYYGTWDRFPVTSATFNNGG